MAFAHITQKEFNVGALIARGRTVREAGMMCHISFHTANTHVIRLYRKFEVHDRISFAHIWLKHEHTLGKVYYRMREPETDNPQEIVLFECLELECKEIITSTSLFKHARREHHENDIDINWLAHK